MSIKILIIDDDITKIGLIKDTILKNESVVDSDIEYCSELMEAIKRLEVKRYDLVLLDIMLPSRMGEKQLLLVAVRY